MERGGSRERSSVLSRSAGQRTYQTETALNLEINPSAGTERRPTWTDGKKNRCVQPGALCVQTGKV